MNAGSSKPRRGGILVARGKWGTNATPGNVNHVCRPSVNKCPQMCLRSSGRNGSILHKRTQKQNIWSFECPYQVNANPPCIPPFAKGGFTPIRVYGTLCPKYSVDELQTLMDGENKTYRDYKNNMAFIELGTNVLRLLGIHSNKFRLTCL